MTPAVCPYCRCPIEETGEQQVVCPGCGTPHHADCFAENGGCTVFGCSQAPVEEPKITVSGSELSDANRSYTLFPPAQNGDGTGTASAVSASASDPTRPDTTQVAPPPPLGGGTGSPPPPPPYGSPVPGTSGVLYDSVGNPVRPLTPAELYNSVSAPKSRVAFILLGIFLGAFGIHNFYSGYVRKGVGQLCITLFTCFYGSIISWIWAIVEVCTVTKDNDGVQFS